MGFIVAAVPVHTITDNVIDTELKTLMVLGNAAEFTEPGDERKGEYDDVYHLLASCPDIAAARLVRNAMNASVKAARLAQLQAQLEEEAEQQRQEEADEQEKRRKK